MSGYDIKQSFESIFSYFFDASYGTIYPTLNQLEKEGYIIKETVIQEGKPNKNLFSITEKGRERFRDYLQSLIEPDVVRSDFLMRLYFGEHVGKERVTEWLEQEKTRTLASLARLEEDYRGWKEHMTPSQEACVRIGISHYRSHLQAVEDELQKLKESE
jgi:DNA-binding PadR family transcriptional regulator